MADIRKETDGASTIDDRAFDFSALPDYDVDFIQDADLEAFAKALSAPESVAPDDQKSTPKSSLFITALNDWRPIHQRVRKGGKQKKKRKIPTRGKDETREGFVYTLLKWPLLIIVMGWIVLLGATYLLTRLYIFLYESLVTLRGRRERLNERLRSAVSYADWVDAAEKLDQYLGNDKWKETDDYAYYNSGTIRRVRDEMNKYRTALEESQKEKNNDRTESIVEELRMLVEQAVKDNFVGVDNPRLYSETYYGTKNLAQSFIDEVELSITALSRTKALPEDEKLKLFRTMHRNYGRTALCLSGGATFAYYHFGVAKALLDADILPEIITGTSGGALVAALLATRTDEELKLLLVPALSCRIKACSESAWIWARRWWRTGARFDSVQWARRCSWFCHGSLTFREAYERTGRILNVTCIPSDPHSPTVLANYLTSPDCVIWSAVLASAAVPGILNPVVLMRKTRKGTLEPYSFGHKWKDGSLRTDIPLKALNTHFNVNFSIVSQVNPHINLFFFSSRGSVGRPVTHRRGRGWRGGFLGSAVEQYLKLDLTKWLKVLRHLELLPRAFGQDWSEIWLQRFSGTITLWPKSILSDFYYILSDPPPSRLARMLRVGQQSAFPKLKFVANRIKVERLIEQGRRRLDDDEDRAPRVRPHFSQEDLEGLLRQARRSNGSTAAAAASSGASTAKAQPAQRAESLHRRFGGWWQARDDRNGAAASDREFVQEGRPATPARRTSVTSVMSELGRQMSVFEDDPVEDSEMDAHASSAAEDGESAEDGEGYGFGEDEAGGEESLSTSF